MKLPRRLSEVIKKKEKFLDDMRTKLEKTTIRLQGDLFERIIEDIIPRLDVKDGKLLETANNYRLITELNRVYDTFNFKVAETILPQVTKGINGIVSLNKGYFALAMAELPKRFDEVIRATKVLTDLRVGLRMDKMIRGGMMMNMIKGDPQELQHLLANAVVGQGDMRDFIKIIKENIVGTDAKPGSLDRQFKRFTYDTFMQYDRAYNKKLIDEFGFKYFVYEGNLIKDSRDFCVCHIDKVYSVEEAQEWSKWVPADCEYPEAHPMKSKRPNEVPSYLGFLGYDPIIDLGGYNCRHLAAFIPDDLAKKLRPDIQIDQK
jgi:hypothetical protein